MTIKDFKAGQRVALIGDRRRGSSRRKGFATVTRVGRKFVYAVEQGFSRETAYRVRNEDEPYLVENIDYGTPIMLFPTEQAADEYIEHEELSHWLVDAANWLKRKEYTLGQLRTVRRILEGKDDIKTVIIKAAERDAAVSDLESACASLPICAACQYCKKYPCPEETSDECDDGLSQFVWRGEGSGGLTQ